MEVYRIAKSSYRTDLTGLGSRLYGARWNKKGTGLVYTSESRALASLEFLVHVPLSLLKINGHHLIQTSTFIEPVIPA